MPGFGSFLMNSSVSMCSSAPGVCRSVGPTGPVQLPPAGRLKRGPRTEEDSSDDPAVEDHEQQTLRSLLPEQL